jgi:uncharacterized membrane-anchored protein
MVQGKIRLEKKQLAISFIVFIIIASALLLLSCLITFLWNCADSFFGLGFAFNMWIVLAALSGGILLLIIHSYFFTKPSGGRKSKMWEHHQDTYFISEYVDDSYFDRDSDPY